MRGEEREMTWAAEEEGAIVAPRLLVEVWMMMSSKEGETAEAAEGAGPIVPIEIEIEGEEEREEREGVEILVRL